MAIPDRHVLHRLAEAIARILDNGQDDFDSAFETAAGSYGIKQHDAGIWKHELGKILNWRREKKKMARSHTEPKPSNHKNVVSRHVNQNQLGVSAHNYPD